MGDTEKRVAIYTRVSTKDQTTDRSSACWARATRSSSPGSIAWSLRDLANVAYEIDEAVANLKVLEQAVDISTGAGRAFFRMLAVFAAFETDVRRERQMEGIVVD